jgi:hypothetical protein
MSHAASLQDRRIRERLVHDKLRQLRSERLLPLDAFFTAGNLNDWQWRAGHQWREDRITLLDARARGHVRKPSSRDRNSGFSMGPVGLNCALAIERELPPEWLGWALALIGETNQPIEIAHAQRVTLALGEFYGLRPAQKNAHAR